MVTIKIEIPAISELADAIHVLASSYHEASKPETKSKATTAPLESRREETEITMSQVRAKLAALSQSGKQAEVRELIQKHGGTKLSDVPKENYAALMQDAEGI